MVAAVRCVQLRSHGLTEPGDVDNPSFQPSKASSSHPPPRLPGPSPCECGVPAERPDAPHPPPTASAAHRCHLFPDSHVQTADTEL